MEFPLFARVQRRDAKGKLFCLGTICWSDAHGVFWHPDIMRGYNGIPDMVEFANTQMRDPREHGHLVRVYALPAPSSEGGARLRDSGSR